MSEGRVKVVIDDKRRIPFVGKGPIKTPIYILRSQFEILKKLGYNVRAVITLTSKPVPERPVEETKDKLIKEEDLVTNNEESLEENAEEEINEELEVEEALEEESSDGEVDSEEVENNDELTTSDGDLDNEEEIIENSEEESDEEEEEDDDELLDIDSMTKNQIKEKLDEYGVKYNKNDNLSTLKDKLLECLDKEEENE